MSGRSPFLHHPCACGRGLKLRAIRIPYPSRTRDGNSDMTRDRVASDRVARDRVDWVDYAKGICIVLVVMMHCVLGVEARLPDGETTGLMGAIVAFAAPFRMPDFFLLSGLFLFLTIDRPWKRYLDRKVVHFAYFYVLWLTIQFALKGPAIVADEGIEAAVLAYLSAFFVPFGTLWFIYMLPIFFLVTRALKQLGVPHWAALGGAALLQVAPIHTGTLLVDEFASRYVWFYAGYALAPHVFALAAKVEAHRAIALIGLAVWALVNGALVALGWAHLPLVSLGLGAVGAMAVVAFGALACTLVPHLTDWLRWLGAHSIVVYLAFFAPMVVSREVLMRFAPLDPSLVSLLVTVSAVLGPVVLYGLVAWSGRGRFLFERPLWAVTGERGVSKAPALG